MYLRTTLRTEENEDKTPARLCEGLYPSQASQEGKSKLFYLRPIRSVFIDHKSKQILTVGQRTSSFVKDDICLFLLYWWDKCHLTIW
jgi:hypothetical protein